MEPGSSQTQDMDSTGEMDSNGLTRRQALAVAAALCGLGAAAVAGHGTAQAAGKLRVKLSDFPALGKVGGAAGVGTLNGIPVGVVRTGASSYVALDRRCTHQGETVQPSGNAWVCPLHFSRFELDGDLISGAARSPLRRLKVRVRKGTLVIR